MVARRDISIHESLGVCTFPIVERISFEIRGSVVYQVACNTGTQTTTNIAASYHMFTGQCSNSCMPLSRSKRLFLHPQSHSYNNKQRNGAGEPGVGGTGETGGKGLRGSPQQAQSRPGEASIQLQQQQLHCCAHQPGL